MPSAEQPIETPRLLLVSVTEAMLLADKKGQGLGELLGATVPEHLAAGVLGSKGHRLPV